MINRLNNIRILLAVLVATDVLIFMTVLWNSIRLNAVIEHERRPSNSNTVNVAREPTAVDLAREILMKKGDL